jgi:hypothetical protein
MAVEIAAHGRVTDDIKHLLIETVVDRSLTADNILGGDLLPVKLVEGTRIFQFFHQGITLSLPKQCRPKITLYTRHKRPDKFLIASLDSSMTQRGYRVFRLNSYLGTQHTTTIQERMDS